MSDYKSFLKKLDLKIPIQNGINWVKKTFETNPNIILLYISIFFTPFILSYNFLERSKLIAIFIGIGLIFLFHFYVHKPPDIINHEVDLNIKKLIENLKPLEYHNPHHYKQLIKNLNIFFKLYDKLTLKKISCLRKLDDPVVFQKGHRKILLQIPLFRKAERLLEKSMYHMNQLYFYLPNDQVIMLKFDRTRNVIKDTLQRYLVIINNLCLDEIYLKDNFKLKNIHDINFNTDIDYINQMKFEK
jgi:hypothetical protein